MKPWLRRGRLEQEVTNFSIKGQMVNVSGVAGHTVSEAATQFCPCHVKAAMGDSVNRGVAVCQ